MLNLDNAALQTAERTFCLSVPGTDTCGARIFENTKYYLVVPRAKPRRLRRAEAAQQRRLVPLADNRLVA